MIFHLLDLTPTPDPDDADIGRFATDREGLKTDIIERLEPAGERPTPVMVEKELARLERLAAAQAAIDAVHAAGGQAHYHSVDLTDGEAVAADRQRRGRAARPDRRAAARRRPGDQPLPARQGAERVRPRVRRQERRLVQPHAARSATCPWAPPSPSAPWPAASATSARPTTPRPTTCCASWRRACAPPGPDTRAIVIDWTAWGGIGMATRGSIPKMMEMAGIEMLPTEVGIPTIRRELTAGATSGEIVVAGRLGIMVEERAERGGVDPARFETATGRADGRPGRRDGRATAGSSSRPPSTPTEQPFLDDHRIEGTPVLPGVMGIEGVRRGGPAAAARVARRSQIEDVEFLAPCKFYRDEPRTLTITAAYRRDGDELVADCRLVGSRQLANQTGAPGDRALHRQGPAGPGAGRGGAPCPRPRRRTARARPADAIYAVYFHGPAYQVLERAWRDGTRPVGLFAAGFPPTTLPGGPARAGVAPPDRAVLPDRRDVGDRSRRALRPAPSRGPDRLCTRRSTRRHGRVEAIVEPGEGGFDGRVVDEAGNVLLEVHGYRTVELPGGVDPDKRAPLAAAMA